MQESSGKITINDVYAINCSNNNGVLAGTGILLLMLTVVAVAGDCSEPQRRRQAHFSLVADTTEVRASLITTEPLISLIRCSAKCVHNDKCDYFAVDYSNDWCMIYKSDCQAIQEKVSQLFAADFHLKDVGTQT